MKIFEADDFRKLGDKSILPLVFSNITILDTDWVNGRVYTDYPYDVNLTLTGVTEDMTALIKVRPDDYYNQNIYLYGKCYNGGVTVFAHTDVAVSFNKIIVFPF